MKKVKQKANKKVSNRPPIKKTPKKVSKQKPKKVNNLIQLDAVNRPIDKAQQELSVKLAKHDRVKALEGAVTKNEVSQLELNAIVEKIARTVKKRGRNKNTIPFKKVRSAFDSYN
jgi:hypothetical protein